jgi:hypothetical protein
MIKQHLHHETVHRIAETVIFGLILIFISLQVVVNAKSHKVAEDYDKCDKYINQWTDKQNKAIPGELRKRILEYLGKDVDYPKPVNENPAHYFDPVQSEEDRQFISVPLSRTAEYGLPDNTIAAGEPIETYLGSSPVTLELKSLQTATIQGHELFIGDYWSKDGDQKTYLNLYEKDQTGAIKELVHGAGAINVFTLGNNSPVFVVQKWQTFNAFVQGDVSRLMDNGSLKRLIKLWDLGISWDVYDICGEGMQQFISSIRIPRPKFPKKFRYCVNSGHCCLRKLEIYKWDGAQMIKQYEYFYSESPDVVR